MHSFCFWGRPRAVFSWHASRGFAILLAAAGMIGTGEPAQARRLSSYDSFYRGWFQSPYQIYRPRRLERAPRRPAEKRPVVRKPGETKVADGKKPAGPLYAVVSLADQHVSFYDANGLWERSVVSTGVPSNPTPPGIFTILEKERWHRSNLYSGAPMPYMQRLTWTGIALHEGVVTGRPASHGCIRLPGAFARRLFSATKAGQRVVISQQSIVPKDIVNAHLPAPYLQPPPEGAEDRSAAVKGKAVEPVALDSPVSPDKAVAKRLDPAEFAQALKAASAGKAVAAAQAKKAALARVAGKAEDARKAARELAAAEVSARKARADVEDAEKNVARAEGEDAAKRAAERKSAAEARLIEAESKVREASEAKAAKDRDVASARDAVLAADEQASAAAAMAKEASLRAEPVSIFISRKTRRLYVRQARQPLFDMPIAIRDPERPLGTHLFIATQAGEDRAALRWAGLTPPAAVEVKRHRHSSRRGRKIEPEHEAASSKPFPETASAALDRIELPPEALQRIGERVWTGATLIISDVGLSGEGRYTMDFMILGRTAAREE